MKTKSSNQQPYNVGQIVAIALPSYHKVAYAKVFKDFDLGVYDFLSDEFEPLERVVKNRFLYFNSVTDRAIRGGAFIVIGDEPFVDEDSAWAPAMASGVFPGDPGIGVPHIDYKGVSRRATAEEVAGMDVRDFSQRAELFVEDLVERLVNGNHQKYRA